MALQHQGLPGSSLNSSAFDAYGDAEPNEPRFTLLGRDRSAPARVREWARDRAEAVSLGHQPPYDANKVANAYEIAAAMETFRAMKDKGQAEAVTEQPMKSYRPASTPAEHMLDVRKAMQSPSYEDHLVQIVARMNPAEAMALAKHLRIAIRDDGLTRVFCHAANIMISAIESIGPDFA